LVTIIWLSPCALQAQSPICSFCKTRIEGRYIKQDDGTVACKICMKNLPRCDFCSRLFVHGVKGAGGEYCKKCYVDAKRCSICNQPIKGGYSHFPDHGIFCNKCETRLPSCKRCGVPLADGAKAIGEVHTALLCRKCYDSAERCHACTIPIAGEYYFLPGNPHRKFCFDCKNLRANCDFCRNPVGGKHFRYSDGRISCAECYETTVNDPETLATLEKQARKYMLNTLGMRLRPSSECPVYMVNAQELSKRSGKSPDMGKGFNTRERGLFHQQISELFSEKKLIKKTETLQILIEGGLPRLEAYGTIAHELTHLWQFDKFSHNELKKIYLEGLACWVQYHALKSLGDKKADRLADQLVGSPDPIYGDGLRLLLDFEKKHGFQNTISAYSRIVR
jgi:hypothetical protein